MNEEIELPKPRQTSTISIEIALSRRRSIRSYKQDPVTLSEISQLLWAAQGITNPDGLRTAPSAGALYPMELYIIAGNIENLPTGIYKYQTGKHRLEKILEGDKRAELRSAALGQSPIQQAPATIIIAAVYERVTNKYGERGIRYVHMEAGHIAQNIYLQAEVLDIGAVAIGGFEDNSIKEVVLMQPNEKPLYLMPIGKK